MLEVDPKGWLQGSPQPGQHIQQANGALRNYGVVLHCDNCGNLQVFRLWGRPQKLLENWRLK